MNSARAIYIEMLKMVKFADEYNHYLEVENKEKHSDTEKKNQIQFRDKIEENINDNEYKKLDACFKATYMSLGLQGKCINKIKSVEAYRELKNELIELCAEVSYDIFFKWLVRSWGRFYCVVETNYELRIKRIEFYMRIKKIVLSVIECEEEERNINKARRMYYNSMEIYNNMLNETKMVHMKKMQDERNEIAENCEFTRTAKKLLKEYEIILMCLDSETVCDEDIRKLKFTNNYFQIYENRIMEDAISDYKEKLKVYEEKKNIIKEYEEKKKYDRYEKIIRSKTPNLDGYVGYERDLLECCIYDYRQNPNINIIEDIQEIEEKLEKELVNEEDEENEEN